MWSEEKSKFARRSGKTRQFALFDVLMSETCTRLWRKAHFEVKMYKTPHARSTFGSSDVERMHAAAEKSTF